MLNKINLKVANLVPKMETGKNCNVSIKSSIESDIEHNVKVVCNMNLVLPFHYSFLQLKQSNNSRTRGDC